jgi:tryptophanyl-tRNA synthetase
LELFADAGELERIAGYYKSGKREGEPFGYGHAKKLLGEHIERRFADARLRHRELGEHPQRVVDVLARSAASARAVARVTLERCKRACGLL